MKLPGANGECLEDPQEGIKLQLGCGTKPWPGFVNVDLAGSPDITSDLRKLPFPDAHADLIVSIHTLEHFYQWETHELLSEWKRVLKPGGRLVLELPCMDKVIFYMIQRQNAGHPMDVRMTWLAIWGDPSYGRVEMCHKWGYTKQMLVDLLTETGFTNPEIQKPRYHFESRDMRAVAFKP